jgi:hypothetical protein
MGLCRLFGGRKIRQKRPCIFLLSWRFHKAQQEADGISFYFDEKVLGKNVLVSKKSITKPLNNKCIYA